MPRQEDEIGRRLHRHPDATAALSQPTRDVLAGGPIVDRDGGKDVVPSAKGLGLLFRSLELDRQEREGRKNFKNG